ncbi:hypothetical protein ACFQU2_26250 [Siccirubricoccus deserti]
MNPRADHRGHGIQRAGVDAGFVEHRLRHRRQQRGMAAAGVLRALRQDHPVREDGRGAACEGGIDS